MHLDLTAIVTAGEKFFHRRTLIIYLHDVIELFVNVAVFIETRLETEPDARHAIDGLKLEVREVTRNRGVSCRAPF